jgi:hypothetical protein
LIHVLIGLGKTGKGNGINARAYFLVEFGPGMAACATGLDGAGFGVHTGHRFKRAFYSPEYLAYGNFIKGPSGEIAALGAPYSLNYARLAQRYKELFKIPVRYAGVFRNGAGTRVFTFGKLGNVKQGLKGIAALG